MTVKLLTNYPPYVQGNLYTSDSATEAALIAAKIATATLTGGTTYVPPVIAQRGSSRSRTAAQLAGFPLAGDISMDSDFHLDTDPTQRYVVNATGTAYVTYGGGGSGAFSGITGLPTDNANLSAALNAKLNLSLGWNGTTPALASGTNPITAGFGSNSFVYTGAGTSPALDGVTGVNGDVFIFGVGGTSTWSVTPQHDPSAVLISRIGAANGVAGLDGGGKVPVAQLPAAVTGSLNYQGTYNAATNTPAITAGNKGFYWKVSVAGTSLGYTWSVGDDVVDNGTTIDQIDGSGLSATVAANTSSIAANTAAMTVQTDNPQIGTTYIFALTDAGQNVDLSNAAAITATIPPHSSVAYPNGTLLYWTQAGAGAVTIAPGAGVTFDKRTSFSYSTNERLAGGYAYQVTQDNWRIYNT